MQVRPWIRVHARRTIERGWHRDLPVTPFAQTLVDYASRAPLTNVRRALARADYEDGLNVGAIEAVLPRGCAGAGKVREALEAHQPALAKARSDLEVMVFALCEAESFPAPELNGRVIGWDVDLLWRAERLAVEVDGPRNHRTSGQVRRDRRKDFELRRAAFAVLRYSDEQIEHQGDAVIAEVREMLTKKLPHPLDLGGVLGKIPASTRRGAPEMVCTATKLGRVRDLGRPVIMMIATAWCHR